MSLVSRVLGRVRRKVLYVAKQRRELRRDEFWHLAAPMTKYLSAESQGYPYLVRAEDRNTSRALFIRERRIEMEVLDRVVELLVAMNGEQAVVGRQFLDVGANIGTATIPALRRHNFGTAICFEPESENVLTLRLNLLLNGLEDRSHVVRAALSDTAGKALLAVYVQKGGKHHIVATSDAQRRRAADATLVEVRALTLDQLVDHGTIDPAEVGLLWMDVQGHEGHILQGAGRLLDEGVPVVLEWAPQALERHGTGIGEIAARCYTHFLDVRNSIHQTDWELGSTPELGDYAEEIVRDGRKFTDLLLVRMTSDAASRLNAQHLTTEAHSETRAS
jgi:FkbM family methyltransferase